MSDYPNRSDLRNPATRKVNFTGQTYGEASAQAAAQAAVPPGSAPSMLQAQVAASQQRPAPRPGEKPFTRPSERPNEMITSGLDQPQIVGAPPGILPNDPVLDQLMMLYSAYPNDGLGLLLSKYWNVNA